MALTPSVPPVLKNWASGTTLTWKLRGYSGIEKPGTGISSYYSNGRRQCYNQ
jgi:hypothetical protein